MERADLDQWKGREVARLLALVETERRYYQEIVASVPVGLLVLSPDLSIVSANRFVRKMFGLRRPDGLLPGSVLDRVVEVLKTGVAQTNLVVKYEGEEKRRVLVGIFPLPSW